MSAKVIQMTPPGILQHFPAGRVPRPQQRELLLDVERIWNKADVILITAPTAAGKSFIAKTIADWVKGPASIITTTNILQDQYREDFPEVPNLKAKASYPCDTKSSACNGLRQVGENLHCQGCIWSAEKTKCDTSKFGFYNYFTYFANKMFRPTLIVDEAHNLLSTISSFSSLRLAQKDHGFPNNLHHLRDVIFWLEKRVADLRGYRDTEPDPEIRAGLSNQITKWTRCWKDLDKNRLDYHWELTREDGETYLNLTPLTIRHLPGRFWPTSTVKKIVLLSATISTKDLQELGLGGYRIATLECDSPISTENRPFVVHPAGAMGFKNKNASTIAAAKVKELASNHAGEKGLIHATYRVAKELKKFLGHDPRFIFHTKRDKQERYQEFRQTEEPKIFVASGMEEGIDLAYDAARWQVIVAVPYAYWGSSWVREKAHRDPSWYDDQAMRIIMQATGRVCRTPDDSGVTYMLDSRFMGLYVRLSKDLPTWFTQSVRKSKP